MNEKNTEQWNNGISNEEISSAKTLDKQNLSKEIKMENEQSDDVREGSSKASFAREVASSSSLLETNHIALISCISDHRWRLNPQLHCFVGPSLMKNFCVQPLFFSNLGLLLSSFDQEFHKNFRDIPVLHAGPKLVDFYIKGLYF